ncbi:hypothetical protein SK128_015505 [Halocaridina rubra]|uniref:Uncharacterized protein n=1 Tax=Halocaridina rubra TaxID=373956 RepID=A0AAN9ADK8_HALRR
MYRGRMGSTSHDSTFPILLDLLNTPLAVPTRSDDTILSSLSKNRFNSTPVLSALFFIQKPYF